MIYKIPRPSVDEYFTILAMHASSRGSCLRRRVGCILVDEHNHVLSTGYNGPPSGEPNCIDAPCPGHNAPSGTALSDCRAIHAEHNAILQCPNIFKVHTAYVTASPCSSCTAMLMQTSCKRIVYLQEYPHSQARLDWIERGRDIDWIYDLISDNSPVVTMAQLYGF